MIRFRSSLLAVLVVLASCASTDPLWKEQQIQERYEALVTACRAAGGAIVIRKSSASASKLRNQKLTRWEMASAQCGRLY